MPLKFSIEPERLEVGCDEAGRGCLAGPVVAAAVILDLSNEIEGLNDSKQLNHKKRLFLAGQIKEKALGFGIGVVSPKEIDEVNILNASFFAMHRALDQIETNFEFIAVDGNRFNPYKSVPHSCEVKGDARFLHIAAASILAKTHRDALMMKLHDDYPSYNWKSNKGYPTKEHREAIRVNGITEVHRRSFQLLPAQMKLF